MMTREYFIYLAGDLTDDFADQRRPEDLLHGGGVEGAAPRHGGEKECRTETHRELSGALTMFL